MQINYINKINVCYNYFRPLTDYHHHFVHIMEIKLKYILGLMNLFQTVQEMQEQLKQVHETALQLATEKEDRQYHMNVSDQNTQLIYKYIK